MTYYYQVIYCTCPDYNSAMQLAEQLVKKKLAACVNLIPGMTSIYRWENQIETSTECLLVIKSIAENIDAITLFLQNHHPYQVPEIIVLPIVAGSENYLQWLSQHCREEI